MLPNFVLTGAGIYVSTSPLYSSSPLPNNNIITSSSSYIPQMGFYCCSNSTSGYTGTFIGLNGNSHSGKFSVEHYSSSSSRAGCMYIYLRYYSGHLYSSEQGIYTCRMPDSAGRNIDVSVGIYRNDYTSEFSLLYTSKLVQYIHTCSHMHAVTCMQFTGLTSVASMYDQYEW